MMITPFQGAHIMQRFGTALTLATVGVWGITQIAAEPIIEGFTIPAQTSVPFTYCIWYLPDPDRDSFLNELAASPPDLFHLGFQIPFKGALGPTYGHELFTDNILPPTDIPRENERIAAILRKMRQAGVDKIIPYFYSMAFFGHPDKRTGFFRFYDRWEAYRSYGLGPRPEADPTLWLQLRGPQPLGGGPPDVFHYDPCVNHPGWKDFQNVVVRELAALGYDGLFFDVNTQYCICPHCEEKFDIELLKKYGRAGLVEAFGTNDSREINLSTIYRDFERIILDTFPSYLTSIHNENTFNKRLGGIDPADWRLEEDWRLLRCYMQDSYGEFPPNEDFDDYLVHHYGNAELQSITPERKNEFIQTVLRYYFHRYLESAMLAERLTRQFGNANIKMRCCDTPRDLLLWVETQRFWCRSIAVMFGRLKQIGEVVLREKGFDHPFYTMGNLGPMSTVDALNKRRVDGIDLVHWASMADMLMFEEMPQPGSLENGIIISNIFAFRWSMAAGTKAGTLLYKVQDDRAADLAEAEVATGGGGAFIQTSLGAPESRRRWKQFFHDRAELWQNGESAARVALLFWSDQVFYEHTPHLATTYRLVRIFSENQIPFDIVTEENRESLARYDLVIAPQLRYVDRFQIERLLAYAENGGSLLIIDPFGTEDKLARPRGKDVLDTIVRSATNWDSTKYGQGNLIRINLAQLPQRESDYWILMEERANAYTLTRDALKPLRETDTRAKKDLGTGFIQLLEDRLGKPLRWCPPQTDAGVYLHPYHLSPSDNGTKQIVIHLVNYRIPVQLKQELQADQNPVWHVQTQSGQLVVQKQLQVSVPLPDGSQVKRVEAFSPTETTQAIAWESDGNNLKLTIPQLEIYQAVVIEFTP